MQLKGATGADLAKARRRRNFIAWLAASIVVVGGIVGYFAYKPWRLKNLHREAREALTRGDYAEASLNAQRALQLDPDFAPACITMAEIGEHHQLPDALAWRERVMHLSGESADTLLAFASTALRFGKVSSARSALGRVSETDRQREDYFVIAGTIALDTGDYVEAARFYENAIRVNPDNPAYRLALGKARCSADDILTREDGRRLLSDISSHPALGPSALRTLIANYEAHSEFLAALRRTHQLVAMPSHEFSDEVLRLRLLRMTDNEKFSETLASAQQSAEKKTDHASALLLWMSRTGLAREGLEWMQKRAPTLGLSPDLRPAMASCYLALGDWNALLDATEAGAWKPMEYVRHAYRARAFREQSDTSFARTEWNLAINAATRKSDALTWLAQMASEWNWANETEQSLWALLDLAPGSRSAVKALQNHYFEKKDTTGIRRIADHLVKTDPSDEIAQNNLALSSLLLNTEPDRAVRIARDLHAKHPDDAVYASTFAFALHCTARTTDGLKILETLSATRLEEPQIAAYYGIMLAANNSAEKARHFLEIGRSADLLREEAELVAKAEQSIFISDE